MARSLEDIIHIQVELRGSASIDLERVEEDPVWQDLQSSYSLLSTKELLLLYLTYYIRADKFLVDAPFTNGPGNLQLEHLEVSNA